MPMELTLLIPIGAFIGYVYNRWAERSANPAFAERLGTLMATGLIVGESLMGVLYAGLVAGAERAGSANSADVLALIESFEWAIPLGILVFSASIILLYAKTRTEASTAPMVARDDVIPPPEATVR